MKRSWARTAFCIALLIACLYGATGEVKKLRQLQPAARIEEVLYVSSPKAIHRMFLGYDGLAAAIYWTRTVQYFGEKQIFKSDRFDLLDPLLRLTTSLDPQLVVAYHFGSVFLAQPGPFGAGEPYKAIALVQHGIKENPMEWKLWVDLGFIHYMELNDFVGAAHALEQGSEIPGAHPFLKTSAASLAQRGGDRETARTLWSFALDSTKDELIRDNAIKHLRALEVDEVVPKLEELVSRFRERTGALPRSFVEMTASGWLRRIPVDPIGNPYKLKPDGRVEVANPDALPFITRGLPPGREASIFDVFGAKQLHQKEKQEGPQGNQEHRE